MDGSHDEGWFTDPYGRHDARWMSDGTPTGLVRDGSVESTDPPPDGPATVAPVRIGAEGPGDVGGGDLRRADDAERDGAFDPKRLTDAAEAAIESAPGF